MTHLDPKCTLSPSESFTSAWAPEDSEIMLLVPGSMAFSLPVPGMWSACTCVLSKSFSFASRIVDSFTGSMTIACQSTSCGTDDRRNTNILSHERGMRCARNHTSRYYIRAPAVQEGIPLPLCSRHRPGCTWRSRTPSRTAVCTFNKPCDWRSSRSSRSSDATGSNIARPRESRGVTVCTVIPRYTTQQNTRHAAPPVNKI